MTELVKNSSNTTLIDPTAQNIAVESQEPYVKSRTLARAFKGVRGTINPDDNHSDKASAYKILALFAKIGHPGMTASLVGTVLEAKGYTPVESIDQMHFLKQLEVNKSDVKVLANGTVIGVSVIPIKDQRKVLAASNQDSQTQDIALLATEMVILEPAEDIIQAIEAVALVPDHSFILNQPNPDIT